MDSGPREGRAAEPREPLLHGRDGRLDELQAPHGRQKKCEEEADGGRKTILFPAGPSVRSERTCPTDGRSHVVLFLKNFPSRRPPEKSRSYATMRLQTGTRARIRKGLKRQVQSLCNQTYSTAKLFYHVVLRLLYPRGGPPILVYRMAKVGSTTIVHSLSRRGLASPILHVQWLTDHELRQEEDIHRRNWKQQPVQHYWNIWEGQYLRRRLQKKRPGDQWHVVTLVRDPVARNISHFFTVGEVLLGLDLRLGPSTNLEKKRDELLRAFLESYEGHEVPLTWFDTQLKAVFALDVYSAPFPRDKGYDIYENDGVKALVIRLEDLNSCAGAAFWEFMGLEQFTLHNANITEQKPFGACYRYFVDTVQLPSEYLTSMYDSKFAQHFYTADELNAFRRRWEAPTSRVHTRTLSRSQRV